MSDTTIKTITIMTSEELISTCAELLQDYLIDCLNEHYSQHLIEGGEVELTDRQGNVFYVKYGFEGMKSREDGYREPEWLDVAVDEAAYWIGNGDEQLMTDEQMVELERQTSIL